MSDQNKEKILIIDDDRAVCASIGLLLKKNLYPNKCIYRPIDVMEAIHSFNPKLILLDMNFTVSTTGKQGLQLLREIRAEAPEIHVILMTGWATVQLAVQGMKLGARDFIAKPWDNKQLLGSIKSILQLYGSAAPNSSDDFDSELMIGNHERFQKVKDLAAQVASTEASVLILGESGTGKELLAQSIHENSGRKQETFVKVNLGGISESLFESEMFGHKKGSFTDAYSEREGRFAMANKGTIFLDEIGELALQSQVKILRVLQEKKFEVLGSSDTQSSDFRLISATNKNLAAMVQQGSFREDLYYRINLITLQLPALRERSSDIPLLARHFAKQLSLVYKQESPYINDEALHWLSQQSYPGNIRELKNQVERTILINLKEKELGAKHFKDTRKLGSSPGTIIQMPEVGSISLEELEAGMIQKTLNYHSHNISKTARSLGISRNALYRRLQKYNIPHEPPI